MLSVLPARSVARALVIAALVHMPGLAGEKSGEPITLRDGLAFVTATINGRGPFRLLIDTGSGSCMLTPEAARKAGLVYDHRVVLTTFDGEKTIMAASNNRVRIGQNEQPGVEIAVTGLAEIRGLDGRADGVLGQSFFGKSAYMIDYRQKRIWQGEEAVQFSRQLPVAVPAIQIEGRTAVRVVLDPSAEPWLLALDSGASDLVVQCGTRCPPASDVQTDGWLLTYGGERPVSHGKLRHVEIGGVTMPPVEAVLIDATEPGAQTGGVLPMRWFSAVYVDGDVVRLSPAR